VGDLKQKVIQRRLLVQSTVMGRSKRPTKLLEDTALARRVFGLLVDRAGLIEVIPATSAILRFGSIFDLDLALHVA
jgi:hypothetical protein